MDTSIEAFGPTYRHRSDIRRTRVPPSARPRNTLVTMRPVYDLTNAVPMDTIPKPVIKTAIHDDPKYLRAKFEGISTEMYYKKT